MLNDWGTILSDIINTKYFGKLKNKVLKEYDTKTIYPLKKDLFNCLKHTSYEQVKVVIIGQDPYHGENEAQGLCFSVPNKIKTPPSLINIFKELNDDLGIKNTNSDLIPWAKQGVLLLNSVLTVEKDKAGSHKDIGWQLFTDEIIKKINEKDIPVVFILWGNYARQKKTLITNKKHLIIESAHPSPLSAYNGFFGSKPFSKTNNFLKKNNLQEINWRL